MEVVFDSFFRFFEAQKNEGNFYLSRIRELENL
jgi:hypothetical protein